MPTPRNNSQPSIAILIPVFNEEKTIAKVIAGLKNSVPEAEIFIYDNNSTDATPKIIEKLDVNVIREPLQGKGNVVRSMFRDIDADVYLMVDGDNTYDPGDARMLIDEVIKNNVDMAVGDRLSSSYFTENKRRFHNAGNRFVRFAINKIFKSKITDVMTGYRAFSYGFVKTFPAVSNGFQIETEMTIHALDKKMRVTEYPVRYRDRIKGSHSKLNTISDGRRVMLTILNLVRHHRPLQFFFLLALILFITGLALTLDIYIEYLRTDLVLRFPTLFLSLSLLIVAVLFVIVGLILDSISQQSRQAAETQYKIIRASRKMP